MEQHEQGSQPNEKNELLAKEGQHDAPVRTQRKRQYVLKAVIITLVLFVWWSATAIESLLNRTPREFGREDTNKNFMNFQDVGTRFMAIIEHAKLTRYRSFRARN